MPETDIKPPFEEDAPQDETDNIMSTVTSTIRSAYDTTSLQAVSKIICFGIILFRNGKGCRLDW